MKLKRKVITLVIIGITLLTACGYQENSATDDFYESVNGQWIKEHKKEGHTYSGLMEQQENVDGVLEEYLVKLCKKKFLVRDRRKSSTVI